MPTQQALQDDSQRNNEVYSIQEKDHEKIIEWIKAELNDDELREAKERVKNSNMLSDIPFSNLFPYITIIFSLCHKRQKSFKEETPLKKMKSSIERKMKRHLPKILAETIKDDDQALDEIISEYECKYSGTPPLPDAKQIYLQEAMIRNQKLADTHHVKKLDLKSLQQFLGKEVKDPFE